MALSQSVCLSVCLSETFLAVLIPNHILSVLLPQTPRWYNYPQTFRDAYCVSTVCWAACTCMALSHSCFSSLWPLFSARLCPACFSTTWWVLSNPSNPDQKLPSLWKTPWPRSANCPLLCARKALCHLVTGLLWMYLPPATWGCLWGKLLTGCLGKAWNGQVSHERLPNLFGLKKTFPKH